MIKPHDNEYWSTRFEISCEDRNRAAEQLERCGTPQDLKAIALPIIRGRIENGEYPGPAVSHELSCTSSVRIWDPTGAWQVGDIVLVAYDRFGNLKYEPYLGEVIFINRDVADIKIDELQTIKAFVRSSPENDGNSVEAGGDFISGVAEKKLQSDDVDEQTEGILLRYGGQILTHLEDALRQDPRFTCIEGKWYPVHKLPRIDNETLQAVHRFLLQDQPMSLDGILPVINESVARETSLLKMAIHVALQQSPDRFEDVGTIAHPSWRARLPAYDKAAVIQYAFDPQTFELLCRPGQQLNKRKAHRLQELNLYAHVVTFTEWQQMAQL